MLQSSAKETTIQLRVSNEQKSIFSKVANLQHTTLSNFVLMHAYEAAQKILSEEQHLKLSPEGWRTFCIALDQPARSISTLQSLLQGPGLLND